ncbi:transporter [Pectobacterium actinidiae]|uniref:transporter n=1 Tax=Pectobacterium actinidiae TaxID=1507808 RepID=UPI002A7FDEAE|nr:transporter [Pectobacterium actinidiae]MDY4316653.1 transporter [Pectobacterium actinidiae]
MKKKAFLLATALLVTTRAYAVEVAPGDFEQNPVGATIGLLYYQYASTDAAYADGNRVSSDYRLKSHIGMVRLLHTIAVSDTATLDPQFLLPFGQISGHGDAAGLGTADGIGDLILTVPLKVRLNDARDVVGLAPYLSVPVGRYDQNAPLNLGENRWKVDLQAAYIKHLGEKWAVDLVGDAIWYGDNNDAGPGSARLEQDVSYAAQLMGRYMPTPTLTFGLGVGHLWGGETTLDGVKQDNQQRTTNLRFTTTAFVTQKDQIQMQLGRDLAVENGAREDFRLNLRYARAF